MIDHENAQEAEPPSGAEKSLVPWVVGGLAAVLIFPLLAAVLIQSDARAGGVDRAALRCADQVAPVGRAERLQSP
jgi:hypothetical protein